MIEEWRPVVGYEGRYAVSSLGRVKNVKRGHILSPGKERDGHLHVELYAGAGGKIFKVHRLVAMAFIGPPTGPVTRHLNGVPDDNRVENLAWGTVSENGLDDVRNGVHPNSSKTHCKRGHPFSWANTYIALNGARQCRRCGAYRARLRRATNA